MTTKPYTVSELVAAVFCEQKVIFDRLHGDRRPQDVRRAADAGTRMHRRFEIEGYVERPMLLLERRGHAAHAEGDRRCFIASTAFGADAVETVFLRHWRDHVLVHSLMGRVIVRMYYAISPRLACWLATHPRANAMTRRAIRALISTLRNEP